MDEPVELGPSLEDVVELFSHVGPVGSAMRIHDADADTRSRARDSLRAALAAFETDSGVRAPASAWLVAASRAG